MLSLILNKTLTICSLIGVMKEINDLTIIKKTTNSIHIQSMEKTNKVLVSSHINSKNCSPLRLEEEIQFGMITH